MRAHLEEIKGDYSSDVTFKEVDIYSDIVTARRYGAQTSPTVMVIDNKTGDIKQTIVGLQDKSTYKEAIDNALK